MPVKPDRAEPALLHPGTPFPRPETPVANSDPRPPARLNAPSLLALRALLIDLAARVDAAGVSEEACDDTRSDQPADGDEPSARADGDA